MSTISWRDQPPAPASRSQSYPATKHVTIPEDPIHRLRLQSCISSRVVRRAFGVNVPLRPPRSSTTCKLLKRRCFDRAKSLFLILSFYFDALVVARSLVHPSKHCSGHLLPIMSFFTSSIWLQMCRIQVLLVFQCLVLTVSPIHLWDTPGTLPVTIPAGCRAALSANISCSPNLVTPQFAAGGGALDKKTLGVYCTTTCQQSLQVSALYL